MSRDLPPALLVEEEGEVEVLAVVLGEDVTFPKGRRWIDDGVCLEEDLLPLPADPDDDINPSKGLSMSSGTATVMLCPLILNSCAKALKGRRCSIPGKVLIKTIERL